MRFIKRLFAGIAVLTVILLIISYIIPDRVLVERSLTINAAPQVIYYQINSTNQWKRWFSFLKDETVQEPEYTGPQSGVNAGINWQVQTIGNLRLIIIESTPFQSVETEMTSSRFGKATIGFTLHQTRNGTLVTTAFESELGWNPITRLSSLFANYYIGDEFEKSLQNLSTVVRG